MLSKRDVSFLNVARFHAEKSQERNKHGAVVVKGGRILGRGFNKFKNSPDIIPEELISVHCSRHAEEVAIHDAGSDLKGAVLYVARVNKQGLDRLSRPCKSCANLIESVGIKRVVYTEEVCL